LRWQDIDLERGTLHVAHSLKHVGGGRRELGETKTEKSNRTITMPQVVITALRAQRKAQMREQAEAGDVWLNGDKLVFTAAFGAPASDSTVRKEFARHVAAAGLPAGLRLHDLRHSNASILGAAGVPVTVVSEQLGTRPSASRSTPTAMCSGRCAVRQPTRWIVPLAVDLVLGAEGRQEGGPTVDADHPNFHPRL
jgi:integrase